MTYVLGNYYGLYKCRWICTNQLTCKRSWYDWNVSFEKWCGFYPNNFLKTISQEELLTNLPRTIVPCYCHILPKFFLWTNFRENSLFAKYLIFLPAVLKETCNSFKKWPFNLWWISNKTINEVRNITKAAILKVFFT